VGVWDIRLSVLFLCLAPGAWGQFSQQGGKLAGSGGVAAQMGWSVAISADGNTAIAGGPFDQNSTGAVWIFTRTGSAWTQQGPKLAGTAVTGSQLGWSVAISADGNTAIAGGVSDGGGLGAAWVFTRANGAWTQQAKLAGSGAVGSTVQQGSAVALSADGNTALVGGNGDSNNAGALWVFTRSNGVWTQQAKLVGSGATGASGAQLGGSAALSADGNTAASGGIGDGDQLGAVWVFTRTGGAWSQQGAKLTGSGAVGTNGTIVLQGTFVALSADGNTLAEGGPDDNNFLGAVWIFVHSGGAWTQQGAKLVPSDATISVGNSVSLSGNGNAALVGGPFSNNAAGAFWEFTRAGGVWTQQSLQQVGSGAAGAAQQGTSVAISGDGSTAIVGGPQDASGAGAAWIFTQPAATHFSVTAPALAVIGSPVTFTVTALDANGSPFPGYTGTVHFSSSDAAAGMPANAALTSGTGTFTATLSTSGSQTITATDALVSSITGTSGAITVGTASATGTAPGSANPGTGAGLSQVMSFTFNDPRGYQDLSVVDVLINTFLDGRGACYFAYTPSSNTLTLVNDAGTATSGTLVLSGGPGSVSNSQCTVSGSGTSAAGSGTTLTLTVNLTFSPSFAGNKIAYLAARDLEGGNSGWQALGNWSVPGASTNPSVTGLNPSRGAGSAQFFTFTFADANGLQDLGILNVLINNFLDGRQACYLAYSVPTNTLFLVNDAGNGLLPGLILNGSGGPLANSQCSVNAAGSSASTTANGVNLILNMSFTPAFNGNRIFYLAARNAADTQNSGWQPMGTWTVP